MLQMFPFFSFESCESLAILSLQMTKELRGTSTFYKRQVVMEEKRNEKWYARTKEPEQTIQGALNYNFFAI